jgi:hypothetical protein
LHPLSYSCQALQLQQDERLTSIRPLQRIAQFCRGNRIWSRTSCRRKLFSILRWIIFCLLFLHEMKTVKQMQTFNHSAPHRPPAMMCAIQARREQLAVLSISLDQFSSCPGRSSQTAMHPADTAGFTRRRAGLCFSRRTLCLPETGVALSVRPTEMDVLESVMQWKKRRKPPLGAKEVKTSGRTRIPHGPIWVLYSAAVFSDWTSSGFASFSLKSQPALYGSLFTRAGLLSSSELISTTSPLAGE